MAYELVGWIGAVTVLTAYWLVTRSGTSVLYHVLNIVGAGGLLANALYHGAFPSTAVNLVWIAIALWGIGVSSRPRGSVVGGASS